MSDEKERIVFGHTMQSLLRVLGEPMLPEHVAGLQALGVQPRHLEPAYTEEHYARVVEFIAAQLWPHETPAQALFELGRAFMVAYRQSHMGKAVQAVTSVIGPHRALERMGRNFRSANNYTETRLNKRGPCEYELWFNHVPHPGFVQGLLLEALGEGTRGLSVSLVSRGAAGEATFRVTWTE